MSGAGEKILIVAGGSLGDLHPFVALAHALEAAGFAPVITTSDYYRDYIVSENLAFTPIRPDLSDMERHTRLDLEGMARAMALDNRFLFHDLIFPFLRVATEDIVAASGGASLIVAHSLAFAGRAAAELCGLPLVNIVLSPMMLHSASDPPAQSGAPYIVAPRSKLAVTYNRLVRETVYLAMPFWARPWEVFRRELGLPKRRGGDLFSVSPGAAATIGLYSPLLAPVQPDHPPGLLLAGFAYHDRHMGDGEAQLGALEAFLAAGDAPIVFTLGSFFAREKIGHYRDCIAAAQRLSRRAVLLVHGDDLADVQALDPPGGVFIAGYVPHSRVFPRACVVAHHGGIGTSGQAMRAGRPQLVTPLMGDQFDNGVRLARLGVARVLQPQQLSAGSLTTALADLLSNRAYAQRAREAAAQVEHDDGARVAAEKIATLLGG